MFLCVEEFHIIMLENKISNQTYIKPIKKIYEKISFHNIYLQRFYQ